MSSSYKPKNPRPTTGRSVPVRHSPPLKRPPVSADMNQPLTLRTQLLVLTVVLLVSLLLFAIVYGLMVKFRSSAVAAPTGTEKSVSVPSNTESTPSVPEYPSFAPDQESSSEASAEQEKSSEQEESSDQEESSKEEESSEQEESSKEEESSEQEESSEEEESSKEEESSEESSLSLPDYLQKNEYQIVDTDDQHFGELILVNKEHACVGNGTMLRSLMDNDDRHYALTDKTVSLNQEVIADFDRMMDDFYAIYGDTDIMVACGFRSQEVQAGLYRREAESVGEEEAALWVAPPGYSEHQTGYAFDLNLAGHYGDGSGNISYENVPPYSWINENCSRYGFILRYPEGREDVTGFHAESWHFRYVGYASACLMAEYSMTLEEYLSFVRRYTAEDPLVVFTDNGGYALYYTEATEYAHTSVLVPSDYSYTISGDNAGGFIVTVSLDN